MRGITKRFPGVVANEHVDFEAAAGEVHALLGENGAGKTTLMNVLTGLYRPDDGEIELFGEPVRFNAPRDALEAGIGMVHQHFRLVETLTVAENLLLGWHEPRLWMGRKAGVRQVREVAESLHMQVDPDARIWQLSVGEQQRVEIIKAVFRGSRVLVLDEPTAVLTPQEADQLFNTLRVMAREGHAVIVITHKLREVKAVADRVTVLRGGRNVATVSSADATPRSLAALMVGREVAEPRRIERATHDGRRRAAARRRLGRGRPRRSCRRRRLTRRPRRRDRRCCRCGGQRPARAGGGDLRHAGSRRGRRPRRRARRCGPGIHVRRSLQVSRTCPKIGSARGLRRASASRRTSCSSGIAPRRSRVAPCSCRDGCASRRSRSCADTTCKAPGPDTPARNLSGGNLQKLVLGREFDGEPRVLIAAQPTRGLDVGAIETVHGYLREAAAKGVAVLLISEDLDEIRALADRIVVMYEGTLAGELDAATATVEDIGLLMAGGRTA